jgi:hypothetical protein
MKTQQSVIPSDPEILGGIPVFVRTRVPVQALIDSWKPDTHLTSSLMIFLVWLAGKRQPPWSKPHSVRRPTYSPFRNRFDGDLEKRIRELGNGSALDLVWPARSGPGSAADRGASGHFFATRKSVFFVAYHDKPCQLTAGQSIISRMALKIEMSSECYDLILAQFREGSALYPILKDALDFTESGRRILKFICERGEADMLLDAARSICPETAAEIERSIRPLNPSWWSVKDTITIGIWTDHYDHILSHADIGSRLYSLLKGGLIFEKDGRRIVKILCEKDDVKLLIEAAKVFCPEALPEIEKNLW